jgi:hypothetical protein
VPFGRKTRGPRLGKIILFCFFSFLLNLGALKAIDDYSVTSILTFQNKSCLKTYGRVFVLWVLCHHHRVNFNNVQHEMVLPAGPAQGVDVTLARPQGLAHPALIRPNPT